MVYSRFTSFVYVLIFIVYRSSADVRQVTEKIDNVAAVKSLTVDRGGASAVEKNVFDAVPKPRKAKNIPELGGRKMMKRKLLTRQMVNGKTKLNTEDVMEVQSANYHDVKRENLSSLLALNADYHPPKSHPPKNN